MSIIASAMYTICEHRTYTYNIIEYFVCSLHRLYCYVVEFNIKVKYARIFVYETFITFSRVPLPDNGPGSQIQIQKCMLYIVHTVPCLLFSVLCNAYWILQSKCIIRDAFSSRLLHLCLCGFDGRVSCYLFHFDGSLYCMYTRKIQIIFSVCLFLLFCTFYRVLHIVILSMNALRLAKNSQITYESAIYFLIRFFFYLHEQKVCICVLRFCNNSVLQLTFYCCASFFHFLSSFSAIHTSGQGLLVNANSFNTSIECTKNSA